MFPSRQQGLEIPAISRNEREEGELRLSAVRPLERLAGTMQTRLKTAAQTAAPVPRAAHTRMQRCRGLGIRVLHAALLGSSVAATWGLGIALSSAAAESIALAPLLAALVAAKVVSFELFRLHRASWRWFGLPDAAAITVANTSGAVLGALLLGPRIATLAIAALLVVEWLVSQGALLGSRMLYRVLLQAAAKASGPARRRVLIYGAGRGGLSLLRQIRDNPASPYQIAGFIDDDPAKRHLMMQMTPVLGNGDEMPRLCRLHQVDEILIAVRTAGPAVRNRFRELAAFAGLPCRFPKRPRVASGKT
jgi:FlaA1/EpsC-like NDP-sugar epimerase